MHIIASTLAGVRIGQPESFAGLTLFPLFGQPEGDRDYLTLDEALAAGLVEIGEVSEGGRVPELEVRNAGKRPVLLLDGEELVGAKQNRVLNLSILVPPQARIVVPVSCVEAGRWAWQGRRFRGSGRTQYARGRARKAAQVSESLNARGSRRADQGAVWRDIDRKAAALGVHSATAAMADLFDSYTGDIEHYVTRFQAWPGQTGALFGIGGRVTGCELFDHPETFGNSLSKLVRSYGLDAIEQHRPGAPDVTPSPQGAQRFVDSVAAAEVTGYDAIGLGEDLRLVAEHLTGAALAADGRVVHLCAFETVESGTVE